MQTVRPCYCFPCRDRARLLYSCGNRDNPGRSQRSHPSGDVCLRWISPAVALLATERWVKGVLLHLVSPGIISVILWEEGQRSLHQTPGPKQWGCSAWTAPRRSHLPQREWSPFVSYCGMRRQIDEGPLIPSGSALRQQAKATVPTHHLAVCLPHSVVMWEAAKLGGDRPGKVSRGDDVMAPVVSQRTCK